MRQLLGRLAAGGGHATMVGTAEQIADEMQRWFDGDGADGFNLMPPLRPESLDGFVALVVPELQRRGLFRTAYSGSTLRGHLAQRGSGAPAAGLSPAKPASDEVGCLCAGIAQGCQAFRGDPESWCRDQDRGHHVAAVVIHRCGHAHLIQR